MQGGDVSTEEGAGLAPTFEALAQQLADEGLPVLVERDPYAPPLPVEDFLAALVSHGDPRLRIGFTTLLLARPDLSAHVNGAHEVAKRYGPDVVDLFELRYEAARCLQAVYRTRLEIFIGEKKDPLPAKYQDRWRLPPRDNDFGMPMLGALAEAEKERFQAVYDTKGTILSAVDYLESLWAQRLGEGV